MRNCIPAQDASVSEIARRDRGEEEGEERGTDRSSIEMSRKRRVQREWSSPELRVRVINSYWAEVGSRSQQQESERASDDK